MTRQCRFGRVDVTSPRGSAGRTIRKLAVSGNCLRSLSGKSRRARAVGQTAASHPNLKFKWQAALLRANAAWQELQALPGDARNKLPGPWGCPPAWGRYWDERELLNAADEALKGALVADAMGQAPQAPAVEIEDPILTLIANYRAGIAAYNADPYVFGVGERDDALVAQTYGPPLEALRNAPPARTLKGAIEAVRFAKADAEFFMGDETIVAMLSSALAYFDGREGDEA